MTGDPMDVLRLPVVAVAPRSAFATELRARVVGWLGGENDPGGGGRLSTVAAAIMPYLSVRGGAAAVRWYTEVFGAVVLGDPIVEADGRVGHVELQIGKAQFALADEYPELDILSPASRGGPSVMLQVVVDDCDAVFAKAAAAGAEVRGQPADQFYGARTADFRDPWGHHWFLHQPIEEVSREEMAERLAGSEFGFAALDDLDVAPIDLGDRSPAGAATDPSTHDQTRPADRVGDLGYFTLDVPDPDVAAAFFGALLGWEVGPGSVEEGRHIATVAPPGGIHGGRPPGSTLYFRVENVEAAASRVRELGGVVLSVTDYPSGATASCRDPQGVPFELWKPAPGY